MSSTADYFVAAFTSDGELVGVASRSISELSPRWLDFWHKLLEAQGPTVRCQIPLPPLQHIALRVTSSNGAALIDFKVHGQLATSAVALTGADPVAESEVLQMFVDSIRRGPLVRQLASTTTPFEAVFALAQRPLYVVIPGANPRISDADQELVQELDSHLAAALIYRPPAKNQSDEPEANPQ